MTTDLIRNVDGTAPVHPSRETLEALRKGSLSLEKRLEVLDHIRRCSACSALLAEIFEEGEVLAPTPDFCANVLRKSQSQLIIDLGRPSSAARRTEQKKDFRRYCLKVACAACVAVVIILSGVLEDGLDFMSQQNFEKYSGQTAEEETSAFHEFANSIQNFYSELFHTEVKND